MVKTTNKLFFVAKILIIGFYLICWLTTRTFFIDYPNQLLQFDLITIGSVFVTLWVINKISQESVIHLWAIFIWIFLAHYFQYYLLISWLLDSSSYLDFLRYIRGFLIHFGDVQTVQLISIYKVSFFTLLGYAIALFLLGKKLIPETEEEINNQNLVNSNNNNLILEEDLVPTNPPIDYRQMKKIALLIIFIGSLFIYFQYEVSLIVETGGKLPFKLQGIVFYFNRLIIPISYATVIYFLESDRKYIPFSNRVVAVFLINSFAISLIIESRLPVPLCLFSLIMIWFTRRTFTKTRLIFLITMISLIPFILYIPSRLRRLSEPGIFNQLQIALDSLQQDFNLLTTESLLETSSNTGTLSFYLVYPLFRLNGAITIFPILNSGLLNNGWEFVMSRFAEYNYSTDLLFKLDVMNYPRDTEIGLSSGFTGGMYLLSGGNYIILTVLSILYTFTWHKIFLFLYNRSTYNRFVKMFSIALLSLFFLISGNMLKMLNAVIAFIIFVLIWDKISGKIVKKKSLEISKYTN